MQPHSSHYELLGVVRNATGAEVKAAYQRLVLAAHPDKAGEQHTEAFQRLQSAWQVLREPASRALYDHQLSQAELRATVTLHDEVDLDDMDDVIETHHDCTNDDGAQPSAGAQQRARAYSYPCRCGDSYVLAGGDLELAAASRQVIVPCRSCSNHILVRLPP